MPRRIAAVVLGLGMGLLAGCTVKFQTYTPTPSQTPRITQAPMSPTCECLDSDVFGIFSNAGETEPGAVCDGKEGWVLGLERDHRHLLAFHQHIEPDRSR